MHPNYPDHYAPKLYPDPDAPKIPGSGSKQNPHIRIQAKHPNTHAPKPYLDPDAHKLPGSWCTQNTRILMHPKYPDPDANKTPISGSQQNTRIRRHPDNTRTRMHPKYPDPDPNRKPGSATPDAWSGKRQICSFHNSGWHISNWIFIRAGFTSLFYCMIKECCPFWYSEYAKKIGQDLLGM